MHKEYLVIGLLLSILISAGMVWYAIAPTQVSPVTSLEYKNTQYGFSFSLPLSWNGYTIVTDTWKGWVAGTQDGVPAAEGPILSIRHPGWTPANPRQDIPIMIFTIAEWDSLRRDAFHIGAAPIGPSELGRNANFVFALPARYNYAFPTGYKEVDAILMGNPLHAF